MSVSRLVPVDGELSEKRVPEPAVTAPAAPAAVVSDVWASASQTDVERGHRLDEVDRPGTLLLQYSRTVRIG